MRQLIILILLGVMTSLSYGQELLTTSYFPLSSNGLGSTITVQDPLLSAGSGVNFNVDRRFRVELVYNRNSHSDLINALKWRLTLKVKNNAIIPQEETLIVDFTPQGTSNYSDWADFKSNLATDYAMTWSVTGMTVEKHNGTSWVPGTISDLPLSDIHLEAMVFNDRIVELAATPSKMSLTNTNQLNWDHVTGAVEYDVEWVFIDLYEVANFTASGLTNPFDFKEGVRITTYKHSHTLDLIYPKGTLYFRIRPKGYFFRTGNKEVYSYGSWSYAKKSGSGNMSLAITSNFEGKKNWQYMVAYAENGMSASTVTYLDGSLRARQQVMQQKSTGQVVASASLYDYEGRSSVQVIPTPVNANSLSYYNNLHKDATGSAFDKVDFDLGTSNPMGTSSGAGRYYSSANDLTSDPFRERVPDAEGYPYSQVIVSNDNLGRPKVSSGVGLTHRMGGGHESYYYYVKPTERDLRELFGSNVGILSHYDKQIQIDVNGQAAVSYSDQEGRVIATGLMASAPASLLPLDNNPQGTAVTSVSSLMPMNLITQDNDGNFQSVTDYMHFNLGSNPITLNYDMLAGGVNSIDAYFGTSCASCFYELEIKVYDPNGALVNLAYNSISLPGAALETIKERYSADALDCESPTFNPALAAITKTITLSMQGEYHIQKILRVDKAALLNYLSTNASSLPGAPHLQDYLDEYASNIITTGCGFDCASFYEQECREELGLPLTGPLSSLLAGDQANVNACISTKCATSADDGISDVMDSDPGQCDMLLGLLKQDLSPGGWVFAGYTPWRNNTANWDINYPLTPSGTFNPTDLQDLEDNWQDGWADLIVTTHPEYCHYTKCEALADVKQYAYTINSVSSYIAAQPIYVNSSGDMVVSNDPLVAHPLYASTFGAFLSNLNSNFQGTGGSIYDYVSGLVATNPNLFQDENGILLTGSALDNRIWSYVRGMYLGERNNFIESGYSPSCAYLDDPNANFADPASLNPTTGITDLLGVMNDNCAQTCANNISFWMSEIEDNCNGLDETELNQIRAHLQNYCLTDCDGYSNMTGAIQLSDLLNSNADLHAVEDIMSTNCGEYTLNSLAVDDTCSNPTTVTYSNVYQFDPTLNKRLALLTGLAADLNSSTTHYTNFITSPLITAILNYTSEFSYLHWTSAAMILKLQNTTTSFNTNYDINTIASVDILSYEIVPQTPPTPDKLYFTVKFTFLNGTSAVHVINNFGLASKTGMTYQFCICEVEKKNISYEYCDPNLDAFDDGFSLQNWIDSCVQDILTEASTLAGLQYADAYEDFMNGLAQSFSTNCFGNLQETFSISYGKQEYDYTLYYYDQAGNLVQTVPPAGVHIVPSVAFNADGVWNGTTEPAHLLKTIYTYNSINQAFKTRTPDGGMSQIWFNSAQQPRYSQTDQQVIDNKYSYSRFDALGRPIEAGLFTPTNLTAALAAIDDNTYPEATVSVPTYDVVKMVYHKQSVTLNTALGWDPRDLNNRVAAILKYETYKGTIASYDHAVFYNYDIHGSVKQLLTDYPLMGANNRYKTVDYQYDVYSGKVLKVIYQKDKQDQFMHRYTYDDDNRLTQVQTSTDGIKWDADARYYYYLHGPLARMELGEDKVQGTDYAYTVHGWLKGINSNSGVATRDMGKDGGTQTHKNRYVAQDAIGFSLTYFNSGTEIDYKPIVTPTAANNWLSSTESAFLPGTTATANLYNGNIRAMITSIKKTDNTLLGNVVRVYKYDQLQRLKEAQTYTASNQVANNSWTGATPTQAHYSAYSYDLNGNLRSLLRKNENLVSAAITDDFDYKYDWVGGTGSGDLKGNRLYHITENALPTATLDDIEDMGAFTSGANINVSNNYVYDASGRLIKDNQEKISSITWNAMNKVSKIIHLNTTDRADVEFRYNAMGQRIAKIVKHKILSGSTYIVNTSQIKTTYYELDAQGNLIATYSQSGDVAGTFASTGLNTTAMMLEDFHLYGASRLGTQIVDQTLSTTPNITFTKSNNRASALVAITLGTFTNGNSISYRITPTLGSPTGSTLLNNGVIWNTSLTLDANVTALRDAINVKTVTTDVSAALWYDKNVSGTVYLELSFGQPGNWKNQVLDVLINGTYNSTLSTGTHMARQFGYGLAKGTDVVGAKRYELSNHLGNVLATISDRKWGVDDGVYTLTTGAKTSSTPDGITDYYLPTILTYSDYDPFGTLQSGRTLVGGDYRYGFQGQERDDEIKGAGNSYNYEYRMHDPRIGRFFACDPLEASYPWYTPYQFSGNKVISHVELEGLEESPATKQIIFIMPQNTRDGKENKASLQVNPDKLGWFGRRAFYNVIADVHTNLDGRPSRDIATFTLLVPVSGQNGMGTEGSEESKDYPGGSTKVETPRTQNGRGPYDQRFKLRGQQISNSSPSAFSRATGWAGLFLAVADLVYKNTEANSISNANEDIEYQANLAVDVINDVHMALQNGWIPQQYINPADIAVISNVLLAGDMSASAQKYIFRESGFQHYMESSFPSNDFLNKHDFSGTINFAKNLKGKIASYNTTVLPTWLMGINLDFDKALKAKPQ